MRKTSTFRESLVERANAAKRTAEGLRSNAEEKAHAADVAEAASYALADAVQLYDNMARAK